MAFEPGHQKVGGRGQGVPNKATTLVRELARRLVQDPKYLESLRRRLRRGEAGSMEPMLWNHAHGRPTEPRETTNALPSFNYVEMLEKISKEEEPKIAARREQALAEFKAEEELRMNGSATS